MFFFEFQKAHNKIPKSPKRVEKKRQTPNAPVSFFNARRRSAPISTLCRSFAACGGPARSQASPAPPRWTDSPRQ